METKQKPRGYWLEKQNCLDEALKYKTPSEFSRKANRPYTVARKNGWLEDCCSHMTKSRMPFNYWSVKENCVSAARQCKARKEFELKHKRAYKSASENGWLEECFLHMGDIRPQSDNDVVYLWRDGLSDLHKIGVTSERIGEGRVGRCGSHNDMDPRIVFMLKVDDARAVEAELLKLGTDPELDSSIDGYTEFRVLNNEELGKAVSTAYQYAVAA